MKLGILGYGKMGKMVEQVAIQQGYATPVVLERHKSFSKDIVDDISVVIDFTHPNSVLDNIQKCAQSHKNIVVGTTGWYDNLDAVEEVVNKYQIGLLYSPNFSIGVSIFHKIVSETAALINSFPMYDVAIHEEHHTQKIDSPSGTAKLLAEAIMKQLKRKKRILVSSQPPQPDELQISSTRCGSIVGTHTITINSGTDQITLQHAAHNREGFALGAICAAAWLEGKKGIFTFEDIFQ